MRKIFRKSDSERPISTFTRYYGGSGTIHKDDHLHVCVGSDGRVTEVWFRCQQLPFSVFSRDSEKLPADELPRIVGMELIDP